MLKKIFHVLLTNCIAASFLSAVEKDVKPPIQHNDIPCPQLSGRIVRKHEASYEQARLVSNYYTSKDRYPALVVYCQSAKDVQNAVLWARCHQVPIRIRSGGHNHEGYSTGSGAIVIDVSEMKKIHIDQLTNIATIEPGLNNVELYGKLFEYGLTHVGGTCSEVGLSGLVLSGGMGPLIRRVGLTCDSLLSIDMVDAHGKIIQATKDNEHKDLFWATCGGGGGNFGVITRMQIQTYPAHKVTWFNIGWHWDQPIERVMAEWQNFFAKPERNWFSHLDLWAKSFPKEELKKAPVKVLGVFWGTPEEAKQQLDRLLKIGAPHVVEIEALNWHQAIKRIEESTAVFLTNKPEYKSSGAFAMQPLPAEALKTIHHTLKESPSPLLNVLLFSMGGAAAERKPTDTAYFYRDARFFINYSIQWLKKDEDQKQKLELKDLRNHLLPYTVGDYVGNPDPDIKDYMQAYYGENARRLKAIKRKYDPENLFNFEQSIPLE